MKSDIRNLDLNLLKALDALLDERSVTRAAARLSKRPSRSVSGMLTHLRDAFNDPSGSARYCRRCAALATPVSNC
jgi:hypothetical protein